VRRNVSQVAFAPSKGRVCHQTSKCPARSQPRRPHCARFAATFGVVGREVEMGAKFVLEIRYRIVRRQSCSENGASFP
jgi:hypothetical protein